MKSSLRLSFPVHLPPVSLLHPAVELIGFPSSLWRKVMRLRLVWRDPPAAIYWGKTKFFSAVPSHSSAHRFHHEANSHCFPSPPFLITLPSSPTCIFTFHVNLFSFVASVSNQSRALIRSTQCLIAGTCTEPLKSCNNDTQTLLANTYNRCYHPLFPRQFFFQSAKLKERKN